MARSTTTKSSAKTKTTKSTVAPKRTTTKSTTKKVTKSAAVKVSTKLYTYQSQLIQKVSLAVFAALAVVAFLQMTNNTQAFTLGYMVRDQVASQLSNTTVFAPAIRVLADVQVRWLVLVLLAVSALFPLLNLTLWREKFEAGAVTGISLYRWLEVGITSALMVEIVALLSGITDVMVLKLIAGSVLLSALLGWLADRQNVPGGRVERSGFLLGVFAGVMPLVVIAVTAVSTLLFGMIRSPWYVYALYAVVLLGFTDIVINQWARYKRRGQWADAGFVERNYSLVGLVVKALFVGVLILGFLK